MDGSALKFVSTTGLQSLTRLRKSPEHFARILRENHTFVLKWNVCYVCTEIRLVLRLYWNFRCNVCTEIRVESCWHHHVYGRGARPSEFPIYLQSRDIYAPCRIAWYAAQTKEQRYFQVQFWVRSAEPLFIIYGSGLPAVQPHIEPDGGASLRESTRIAQYSRKQGSRTYLFVTLRGGHTLYVPYRISNKIKFRNLRSSTCVSR